MPQRIVFDALKITDKNGNDKQIPVIGIQSNTDKEQIVDAVTNAIQPKVTELSNRIVNQGERITVLENRPSGGGEGTVKSVNGVQPNAAGDVLLTDATLPAQALDIEARNDIATLKSDIADIAPYDAGNLISGHPMISGYWNNSHFESTIYKYAAKVPVTGGKTYIVAPRSRMVYLYDSGNKIDWDASINRDNITSFDARVDGYAYITFYASNSETTYKVYESGVAPESIPEYNSRTLNSNIKIEGIEELKKSEQNIERNTQEIGKVISSIDEIRTVVIGKNIANPDDFTVNYFNANNDPIVNDSYYSTPLIEITPGKTYYVGLYFRGVLRQRRIIYMQFDKDKRPISDTYKNIDTNSVYQIDTVANAKYIRVATLYTPGSDTYKLYVSAEELSEYEPYKRELVSKMKIPNYDEVKSAVKNNTTKTDLIISANMLNGENAVSGFWNGNHNNNLSTAYHYYVLQVKGGQEYSISPRCRMLYCYSRNGELIESDMSDRITDYTATKDGTLYITYYNSDFDTEQFSEKGKESYPKGQYRLSDTVFVKPSDYAANPLYGKKWAVCGDSFTAAGYYPMNTLPDGKYKGKNWTYPWLIGNRTGVEIYDFSLGGRTLAYPAVPDGFTNSLTCPTASCYYQNIPEDTDIITIYLGINDSHHRSSTSGGDGEDNTGVIPLGTITDNTTTTYYGAWNVVLTWLLENRPFAHIGILVSNGCDTADYRVAQLAIAKKFGVPYIDLNGDEHTPVMIRSQNPDISSEVKRIVQKKQAVDYDGSKTGSVNTHPNDEAHEYESHFIEAFLRSI